MSAVVHKPKVSVHAKPDFASQEVTSLARDTQVRIDGQEGLWYPASTLAGGGTGYVRVNELRMAAPRRCRRRRRRVVTGKAGKGRVSETAGVRGIDESDLRGAGFDGAQLAPWTDIASLPMQRRHGRGKGWQATQVAIRGRRPGGQGPGHRHPGGKARWHLGRGGLLGRFSSAAQSMLGIARQRRIEVRGRNCSTKNSRFGPQIAGRILGARPLWSDAARSNAPIPRPLGGLATCAPRIALDLRRDRHAGNQSPCCRPAATSW
jgi:hypothetical protein